MSRGATVGGADRSRDKANTSESVRSNMQYECVDCGTMTRVGSPEEDVRRECPMCETVTLWEPAFEGQGVSF